jgi:hypothetical protein
MEQAAAAARQHQRLDDVRTAQLASMAESADVAALEKALGAAPLLPDGGALPAAAAAAREAAARRLRRADTPPDPRRALMREVRAEEWRRLSVAERDAVLVLSAMAKV